MRTRRRLTPAGAIALVLAVSLLAAGCGGGASPGVASVSSSSVPATSSPASSASALVLAGRCLRAHGLPNMPDPAVATNGPAAGQVIVSKQFLKNFPTATVSRALAACGQALAAAGFKGSNSAPTTQQVQYLLAFARCMRNHGVTDFPDPNGQGQFDLAGSGINKNALTATQLRAAHACVPASHGQVHIPTQDGG